MDGCSLVFICLGRSQGEAFTLVLNTRAKSESHLDLARCLVDFEDIALVREVTEYSVLVCSQRNHRAASK